MSADGQHEVGKINKQWAGCLRGCTDSSNFGVSFPMDLDVKMKATMMGALFLIVSTLLDENNIHYAEFNWCRNVPITGSNASYFGCLKSVICKIKFDKIEKKLC